MQTKLQNYFFFTVLIGIMVLTFFVFKPYLSVLVLAAVLAVLFAPVHRHIQKTIGDNHPSLGALLTLLVIVLVVMTPLFFIGLQISFEARDVYVDLAKGTGLPLTSVLNNITERTLGELVPGGTKLVSLDAVNLNAYLGTALKWFFSNLDAVFGTAAKLLVDLFILILALYFMIRDGKRITRAVTKYSPLIDSYDEQIMKKLSLAVQAVIRGSLVVGIIQGILTGLGFALFGVPNPALWGSFAVIAALIPGVGTALVLIPGILYLIVTGSTAGAIGLLAWAVLAVGLVDNILGPYLVKRGVQIHQFLVLLSVIGGLSFFGPIGFIMGPLVLALLVALLDIYKSIAVRESVDGM